MINKLLIKVDKTLNRYKTSNFWQEKTKQIPDEISRLKYVFIFLASWRIEPIHIK